MERKLDAPEWTLRQKLALTCRIPFDGGHDSGLAGQITARARGRALLHAAAGTGL